MTARNRWGGGTPNNPGYPQRWTPPAPGYPIAQPLPTVDYASPDGQASQLSVPEAYVVEKQLYCNFVVLNGIALDSVDAIQLLQPDQRRTYLLVQNKGSVSLWMNFGSAAGVDNGIELAAQVGFLELNREIAQQDVHLYADGGDCKFLIVYANRGDFVGD